MPIINPRPEGVFPDPTPRWWGGVFCLPLPNYWAILDPKKAFDSPGLNFPNMYSTKIYLKFADDVTGPAKGHFFLLSVSGRCWLRRAKQPY